MNRNGCALGRIFSFCGRRGSVAKYLPAKRHWKMVLVLLCICGALMLIRWAAIIWA